MAGTSVGKRRFHAFLSHAHVDKSRADQFARWLGEIAKVPVWYDASNMPPGAIIEEALPDAIEQSRSMILLLSKESVARGWVQHEYRAAINQQTRHRPFRRDERRVAGIIEGCGAFAAILPYRSQSPHKTSKYVLLEWELAAARNLPCLVVADPRVELPPDIAGRPGYVELADEGAVDARC